MKMTKLEISQDSKNMLESMPQTVAISVMISLAVNLIRAVKGELKEPKLVDDPIQLIAEVALMTMIAGSNMEQPTVEQSEMH